MRCLYCGTFVEDVRDREERIDYYCDNCKIGFKSNTSKIIPFNDGYHQGYKDALFFAIDGLNITILNSIKTWPSQAFDVIDEYKVLIYNAISCHSGPQADQPQSDTLGRCLRTE